MTVSAERQAPVDSGQVPAGRPRLLLPGLSANPAAARIDLDENGEIVGLS